MSIFTGLNQMLNSLTNGINNEKDRLIRDTDDTIKRMGVLARSEFDKLFNDVANFLTTSGDGIKKDFENLESIYDEMEKKIETAGLKAVHGFIDRAEDEIQKIESTTNTALREIHSATHYIRSEAYNETINAVDAARKDIARLKKDFEESIIEISKNIIGKTKNGIDDIKNSASADISKLNSLRTEIDGEIEAKFGDVKALLIKAKNSAEKELDGIASLVRSEVQILEKRVKKMADTTETIMNYLAIAILTLGGTAAIGIVLYKMRRDALKLELELEREKNKK
jgi:hypothetical protein